MSKLIMQFLLQTNQNKILHCCYTSVTYHSFSIMKTKRLLLTAVRNKQNNNLLKQCEINQLLNFKRTLTDSITNIEDEEDTVNGISDFDKSNLSSTRIRDLLYPDSNDPIINKLKLCQTVQEVFDIIDENEHVFNHEHCSQSICVLWDLQKMYEYANSISDILDQRFILTKTPLLDTFKENLNKHPKFNTLLHLTSVTYKEMSMNALSCSFLYLRRMGVGLSTSLLQNLTIELEHLLATVEPAQFPLSALSKFAVGIFYDMDLRASQMLVGILPHIYEYSSLGRIDNVHDFRNLTISMRTVVTVMDTRLLNNYIEIIEQLIIKGVLTSDTFSTIIKSLLFLSQPHWMQKNIFIIRKLLLLLRGMTNKLTQTQILFVQKVLNYHLEPYALLIEVETNSSQLLAEYKIGSFHPNETFLSAAMSGKQYRGRIIAKEIIKNATSISSLTEVGHFITTADLAMCNQYWMKILEFVKSPDSKVSDEQLFGICTRYMNFSSNMSWYRNKYFEKQIIEHLTSLLVEGVAGHIPSKFCQIAAFLLAYSSHSAMPQHIVSRLLEYINQFSVYDCEYISKGLSVAIDIRRHHSYMSQEFLQQFVSLDAALNSLAMQFLKKEENCSLGSLNKIMRSYIHRKGATDTELFEQLVRKYEVIEESDLSSRGLRNIVYNLLAKHCLIPTVLDKVVSYCIKQRDHIIGDTACKLIYSCYFLGYIPLQGEEFFNITSEVITRDRDRLTGLGILQASLALSYFNHLPASLIQFIFTVDFLEHLDEEIKHCFAKAIYPVRIRRTLMELNRAMCLDHPEAGVPWFHSKYCEEQRALGFQQHSKSPFFSDVQNMLVMATGSNDFVQTNVSSPYGYNIDLQVCLDRNQQPIDVRGTDIGSLNKLAILLQGSDSFTTNVHQLKGYNQMMKRHLEIMGYRVISVSDSLWNAMYMAEPKAKLNHVKNLIWPSVS